MWHRRRSECKECVIAAVIVWRSADCAPKQPFTTPNTTCYGIKIPVDVLEINYDKDTDRNFMRFQIKEHVTRMPTAQYEEKEAEL